MPLLAILFIVILVAIGVWIVAEGHSGPRVEKPRRPRPGDFIE